MYFVTAQRWMKWMYPGLVWNIPTEPGEKILYLSFDDGPHPIATPFVLEQLRQYNAKGSFFCIGKNVAEHSDVYQQLLLEHHRVGNHTYHHLNGWKVSDAEYINDVLEATALIDSRLFRPPYGRITRFQSSLLRGENISSKRNNDGAAADPSRKKFAIVMWSVLAADWDQRIDGGQCAENVILNTSPGSIVVFHDSAKALPRLTEALPRVLEFYANKGYRFEALPATL